MSYEILMLLLGQEVTTHLHYLVFKEQNLREIISQNQVKWLLKRVALKEIFSSYTCEPRRFHTVLLFYFVTP